MKIATLSAELNHFWCDVLLVLDAANSTSSVQNVIVLDYVIRRCMIPAGLGDDVALRVSPVV